MRCDEVEWQALYLEDEVVGFCKYLQATGRR